MQNIYDRSKENKGHMTGYCDISTIQWGWSDISNDSVNGNSNDFNTFGLLPTTWFYLLLYRYHEYLPVIIRSGEKINIPATKMNKSFQQLPSLITYHFSHIPSYLLISYIIKMVNAGIH